MTVAESLRGKLHVEAPLPGCDSLRSSGRNKKGLSGGWCRLGRHQPFELEGISAFGWLRLLVVLSLCVATAAYGQRPLPTDIELRASYCVRVLQSDIANLNSLGAKIDDTAARIHEVPPDLRQQILHTLQESKRDLPQKIAERESALNRVQLFILPRIKYLDATALLAATRRAESDLRESAAVGGRCLRQCAEPKAGETEAERSGSCLRSCMGGDLQSRLEACRNPTWLPF